MTKTIKATFEATPDQMKRLAKALFDETDFGILIEIEAVQYVDPAEKEREK